jgi:hypothetical protein
MRSVWQRRQPGHNSPRFMSLWLCLAANATAFRGKGCFEWVVWPRLPLGYDQRIMLLIGQSSAGNVFILQGSCGAWQVVYVIHFSAAIRLNEDNEYIVKTNRSALRSDIGIIRYDGLWGAPSRTWGFGPSPRALLRCISISALNRSPSSPQPPSNNCTLA